MPGHAPGFSFALHLLRVQGFYFALSQYSRIQAFTARFAVSMQLYRPRHVRAHTRARTPCTDTRYHRHAGRCTGQCRPPIIIRYIRVCPCYGSMPDGATYRRPCKPGGVSVSTCIGSVWHPPPGGTDQRQGRGGRRGTIGGYRSSSFRAFAR